MYLVLDPFMHSYVATVGKSSYTSHARGDFDMQFDTNLQIYAVVK